ncbi:hypothetical protein TNCV_1476341 [Trichonephila clavipes]|nr:hypothetical protein TNCV_1476341 [Trichonephila clavipes]
MTPQLAPPPPSHQPHNSNGRTLSLNRFNLHHSLSSAGLQWINDIPFLDLATNSRSHFHIWQLIPYLASNSRFGD